GLAVDVAFLFEILSQLFRIHRVGLFVDVDKVRPGSRLADSFGSGDKGVGNGDDHVAGLHSGGGQSEADRVGATGHADAIFRVAIGGEVIFEILNHRHSDEAGAGADFVLVAGRPR